MWRCFKCFDLLSKYLKCRPVFLAGSPVAQEDIEGLTMLGGLATKFYKGRLCHKVHPLTHLHLNKNKFLKQDPSCQV